MLQDECGAFPSTTVSFGFPALRTNQSTRNRIPGATKTKRMACCRICISKVKATSDASEITAPGNSQRQARSIPMHVAVSSAIPARSTSVVGGPEWGCVISPTNITVYPPATSRADNRATQRRIKADIIISFAHNHTAPSETQQWRAAIRGYLTGRAGPQ